MTEKELNEFIKNPSNRENQTLEYKLKPNFNEIQKNIEEIIKKMHFNILKTIYAFANAEGGELYIGVNEDKHEDMPYKAIGIDECDKNIIKKVLEKLDKIIKIEQEDISLNNGRIVIKIKVDKLKVIDKPIFLDGVLYVRENDNTKTVSSFKDYSQLCEEKQLYMCYVKGIENNLKKLAKQSDTIEIQQLIEGLKIHINLFIDKHKKQITDHEKVLTKAENLLKNIKEAIEQKKSNQKKVDSQNRTPVDSLINNFIETYKTIISKG